MKAVCEKWKDLLLEAALSGAAPKDLEEHLRSCQNCAAELRSLQARRVQLDALLPMVAKASEPSAGFRARVLATAEAAAGERKHVSRLRAWAALAGASATAVTVLVVGMLWHRESQRKIQVTELEGAQKLAEWRAPSDTLLATPGREILRTTPKLGESYFHVPMSKVEEER